MKRSSASLLLSSLFGILALVAATLPDAGATTLVRLSMADMVDAADAIVIGEARGAESVWIGRNLYTRYRIAVKERLLGPDETMVEVVVPGGIDMSRKHPIAVVIADAPVFRRDEPVALLLARGSPLGGGSYTIVGFNQGRIGLDMPARSTSGYTPSVKVGAVSSTLRADRVRALLEQMIARRGQPSSSGVQPVSATVRGASAVVGRKP